MRLNNLLYGASLLGWGCQSWKSNIAGYQYSELLTSRKRLDKYRNTVNVCISWFRWCTFWVPTTQSFFTDEFLQQNFLSGLLWLKCSTLYKLQLALKLDSNSHVLHSWAQNCFCCRWKFNLIFQLLTRETLFQPLLVRYLQVQMKNTPFSVEL